MNHTAADLKNKNKNYDVEFRIKSDGWLKIEPRPVTITVNLTDQTKVYNGETQSAVLDVDFKTTDKVLSGTKGYAPAFKSRPNQASGMDVGDYRSAVTDDLSTYSIFNYGTQAEVDAMMKNFDIKIRLENPGYLHITKAKLTITAKDQEFTYNGKTQGEGDAIYATPEEIASKVSADGLKGSDTLTSIELFGQATDAGEYSGMIEPKSAVISSSADNYVIEYVGGTLTINKAPLTITTPSGTKVYDGTPITRPNGTVTGLVNGETATVTGTGSQTAVGSSQNGYTINWGTAKPGNYEIVSENLGTLTVTAAPGGGDNPGGGGGPTVTPAGPGTPNVIPDEPTPTVDPPVDIVDPEPPLAGGVWALVNMISAILTALGAVVALFRKKEEEDEEDEDKDNMYKSEDEDEDDNRGKKMFAAKVAGALAGVAAPITFFLTEDMSLPMAMIDKWTVLMVAMLAVQIVAAVFNKKAAEAEDDQETAEEAAN